MMRAFFRTKRGLGLLMIVFFSAGCESLSDTVETVSARISRSSVATRAAERRVERIESIELDIIEQVNAFRAQHNKAPLIHHPQLSDVAREHSRDMADRGYYAHIDPDGVTPNQRIERTFAPSFVSAGTAENIAYRQEIGNPGTSQPGSSLGREFMEGWINSPGHRANLLHDQMTLIGVGVYASGDKVLATQKFMDYLVEIIDPEPGARISSDDPSVMVRVNPGRITPQRLVVKVNLPDPTARWELANRRFYTGFGFVDAEWISEDHVTVRLPVDRYGPGSYSLQFGDRGGNATYDQRVEYTVR